VFFICFILPSLSKKEKRIKQKLKTLKLLILASLAGLLLYGCQVEQDNINQDLNIQKVNIMHKKFEDLLQETQFKTAFEKIVPQKKYLKMSNTNGKQDYNTMSRTIMEYQYGFTIANIPANEVVTDSVRSYTLYINRSVTADNVFENLIININNNQEVTANIIKYTSDTSYGDVPFNVKQFKGKSEISPIVFNATQSHARTNYGCEKIRLWVCYGPGHHPDSAGCTMGFLLYQKIINFILLQMDYPVMVR
jgi:hypothetical protein